MSERTAELDGVELHIEGDGPRTIVMVHGWPDTWRLWDAQVAYLRAGFRCVRFTLPGFDRRHPRRPRTLDEMTAFLEKVVAQHAPGGRAILLLHDWGCIFGYELARRHPERVERIIGVDVGDVASLQRSATPGVKLGIFAYQLWLAAAWKLGGSLGDRMTRRMARAFRAPAAAEHIGAHMNYPYWMTWFGGGHAYRRQLRRFEPHCPMLYLYGRRKPFMFHAPAWLDALRARPGSGVAEFDTGHWVMVQASAPFNETVGAWLGGA